MIKLPFCCLMISGPVWLCDGVELPLSVAGSVNVNKGGVGAWWEKYSCLSCLMISGPAWLCDHE